MNRLLLIPVFAALALAQSPQGKPAFETASIRPGPSGNMMDLARSGALYVKTDDSQFSAGSYPLLALIRMAFDIPQDQIVGPDWMSQARFDLHAKLPAGSSKNQVPAMLLTLLEERFRMTWHRDPRVEPVYLLMVAKDGPKLRESTQNDLGPGGGACQGGFHKVCKQTTMATLALMLTRFSRGHALGALDHPVIDETGLKGRYDFDFDQGVQTAARGGDASAPPDSPDEITGFEAVKVLGLRLELSKYTYDYIVIDHIERTPTEN